MIIAYRRTEGNYNPALERLALLGIDVSVNTCLVK